MGTCESAGECVQTAGRREGPRDTWVGRRRVRGRKAGGVNVGMWVCWVITRAGWVGGQAAALHLHILGADEEESARGRGHDG